MRKEISGKWVGKDSDGYVYSDFNEVCKRIVYPHTSMILLTRVFRYLNWLGAFYVAVFAEAGLMTTTFTKMAYPATLTRYAGE